jgi:hypothetical protein
MYHYRLSSTGVAFDDLPDPVEERFNAFLGRFDQKFATVLAHILTQEIEPFRDVGDPSFLIRELQTPCGQ